MTWPKERSWQDSLGKSLSEPIGIKRGMVRESVALSKTQKMG